MAEQSGDSAIATNRKAFFNYEILEKVEAGISLVGSEVKGIREAGLNFRDSYVDFKNGELYLVGCHIPGYTKSSYNNHAEDRQRKLLLHKREILKMGGRATERGLTIVPLRAYFKNGKVKVEIGLARGKQSHDKRASIKARDIERETRQDIRERRR